MIAPFQKTFTLLLCLLALRAPLVAADETQTGTATATPAHTVADRPLKFAVLGDVHVGLRGADHGFKMTASSERLFEITVEQINAMGGIDFVVFDGDLVTDGESFNYARFKEIADQLEMPYFVVLGNHDQPVIPSTRTWTRDMRDFYPGETKAEIALMFRGHGFGPDGRTWWSTNFNGVHLVGLDSAHLESWSGILPRQEVEWLKRDLSASKDSPTLVFLHHNFIGSFPQYNLPDAFLVDNRDEIKAVFNAFPKVQAVISAHYHFSDFHTENGIQYFTTPSIQTDPCRFAVFEWTPKALSMRTHLVGEGTKDQAEADAIRVRSRDEIAKADDWVGWVKPALEKSGKPSDPQAVGAAIRGMFEANSSVSDLPLRSSNNR